jgi:hypothetical protein
MTFRGYSLDTHRISICSTNLRQKPKLKRNLNDLLCTGIRRPQVSKIRGEFQGISIGDREKKLFS